MHKKIMFGCGVLVAVIALIAIMTSCYSFDPLLVADVRVVDGDSLSSSTGGQMRLLCIDAPEYAQPGGIAARQALRDLIKGETVVHKRGVDSHNRALVILTAHKDDAQQTVNVEMVRRGHAWVYRRYADVCGIPRQVLCAAEREAREARRGLWGATAPIPPWRWRHGKLRPLKRFPPCEA